MINDEIIANAIKNAGKDQYGQTPIINKQICSLFPNEDEKMIVDYLKTSKKYCLSTYGWRYGTYQAISLR